MFVNHLVIFNSVKNFYECFNQEEHSNKHCYQSNVMKFIPNISTFRCGVLNYTFTKAEKIKDVSQDPSMLIIIRFHAFPYFIRTCFCFKKQTVCEC